MPPARKTRSAPAERIAATLKTIRENVPGALGSIAATSDGFPIAQDVPGLEPTQIAALVATMQAVALRATLATGCGQFREVVTRGSEGYLAVYAAGRTGIVAIIGSSDLNVGMLNFQARKSIEEITRHAAEFERWTSAQRKAVVPAAQTPAGHTSAGQTQAGQIPAGQDGERLPVRRPRTS
jgi:uncharacterized protein